MHARLHPRRHDFDYPTLSYVIALNELPKIDRLRLFSKDRFNLLSLVEGDYLRRGDDRPLKDRVSEELSRYGLGLFSTEVVLVTGLRLFGYVFNPVSFYFCYSASGEFGAFIAEVNNTFGERHLYVMPVAGDGRICSSTVSKDFHVSPFYDMKGEYRFRFRDIRQELDVAIDLYREGQCEFVTRVLERESLPFTDRGVMRALIRQPLDGALTMPRIMKQASSLYLREKLPVYPKPIAESPNTIRVKEPNWFQQFSLSRIVKFLKKLKVGQLNLVLPEGQRFLFGATDAELSAEIRLRDYNALSRIVKYGDIGFGEGYVEGEWDSPDLGAVIRLFAANLSVLDDRKFIMTWVGRVWNILTHKLRRNSLLNSKANIQAHYDLSNELFETFLDPSMTYSCALFKQDEQTLEAAQVEKIRELIKKAELKPSDHVLEIGCGWGALAITAAREIGCRVTGITLSEEQKHLAEERIRAAGLSHLIEIKLIDYRLVEGQFDKIISVEMIEAVGHEYLGKFFEVCDRLLKPGGRLVLQAITIPDHRYTWYRFGCDWIQKYIFPGGSCPSLRALSRAMQRNSTLVMKQAENIGLHYARTLREWRELFFSRIERIESLGFDRRFQRIWNYYLTYCEEGFATEVITTHQIVIERG
jgi:cyclopropane-fatty-acyl-phospholipid synthase